MKANRWANLGELCVFTNGAQHGRYLFHDADRVTLEDDRVWGRGDGATVHGKFTGVAAWVARSRKSRCQVPN